MSEWIAYHRISPIGETRRDLQAGVIAAMVGNAMGARKKGKRAKETFTASDFLIDAPDPDASQQGVDNLDGARALYDRKRRQP